MRKFFIAAAVAVVSLVASGSTAQAAIELRIYEGAYTVANTSTSQTVNDPVSSNTVTFTGNVGDFNLFIAVGRSNSPGTAANALTQQGTITITNTSASTQTLHIDVSAQDFTSPNSPPPLRVLDTIAGTLVGTSGSSSVTGNFVGSADAGNTLFGTGFSPAGLHLSFSANGLSQSGSQDGVANGFLPNGSAYSLTGQFTITLTAGDSLTGVLGNIQTVPTPAPAGLVLALSGLPILGLGWLRRRRHVA